jgi:hypothetical protein
MLNSIGCHFSLVIPRLGLGIHEFLSARTECNQTKLVDAKAKPWHDDV